MTVCGGKMTEIEKLKAEIEQLKKDKNHLQFKVDSLMMEFCPDEMTDEQIRIWEEHQQISKHN